MIDDDKRAYILGAAAALVATAIVREFRTGFRDMGRPMAKATIKSVLTLMDKGREVMAHMGEVVEDLTVEARYELDAARTAESAAPQEPPATEKGPEVH